MDLPKIKKSDKGVFSGIKSKLGFSSEQEDYDEEYYAPESYGEYDSGYHDYDDGYESYDNGGYRSEGGRYDAHGGVSSNTSPRLISIDDVRANTQLPDSLTRDPLPSRVPAAQSASYASSEAERYRESSFSRPVEHAADYLRSTPSSDLPRQAGSSRSRGYDSLFASSSDQQESISTRTSPSAYDPYESYAGTRMAYNPQRSLNVLRPMSYGEAELIAKTIKGGDVVILSLRNTPDHLTKRILDFSFGVSSALEASVECIAEKVFVIVRGEALNVDEKTALRNQGVL